MGKGVAIGRSVARDMEDQHHKNTYVCRSTYAAK